jgi:hypothetical protein
MTLLSLDDAFEEIHSYLNVDCSWRKDIKFVRDNISDELEVSNERLDLLAINACKIVDTKNENFRNRADSYRENLPRQLYRNWLTARYAWLLTEYYRYRDGKAEVNDVHDPAVVEPCWLRECAVIALWPHTEHLPNRGRLPMHDWFTGPETQGLETFHLGRSLDDYEAKNLADLFLGVPENPTKWLNRKKSAFAAVQLTIDWVESRMKDMKGVIYEIAPNGTRHELNFESIVLDAVG